jgi:hypothetical protein
LEEAGRERHDQRVHVPQHRRDDGRAQAEAPETRARRVDKAMAKLRAGKEQ